MTDANTPRPPSSWNTARTDAENALRPVLASIQPRKTRAALAWFETQHTLDSFLPRNIWPVKYHQVVTRAAQRILLKSGAQVQLVLVATPDYARWLGDRINSAALRAEFLATTVGADYVPLV